VASPPLPGSFELVGIMFTGGAAEGRPASSQARRKAPAPRPPPPTRILTRRASDHQAAAAKRGRASDSSSFTRTLKVASHGSKNSRGSGGSSRSIRSGSAGPGPEAKIQNPGSQPGTHVPREQSRAEIKDFAEALTDRLDELVAQEFAGLLERVEPLWGQSGCVSAWFARDAVSPDPEKPGSPDPFAGFRHFA
jgi:hypothetical protein